MTKLKKGDLVVIRWRDSFAEHGESKLADFPEDCTWYSVGFVVRQTDLFLTICGGVQETTVGGARTVDNLLSVPWTQILDTETL